MSKCPKCKCKYLKCKVLPFIYYQSADVKLISKRLPFQETSDCSYQIPSGEIFHSQPQKSIIFTSIMCMPRISLKLLDGVFPTYANKCKWKKLHPSVSATCSGPGCFSGSRLSELVHTSLSSSARSPGSRGVHWSD